MSPAAQALVATRTPAALQATVAQLQERFGTAPDVAVVLGSGWGGFASQLSQVQDLPYTELPAFAAPHVQGHCSELIVGYAGTRRVAVLRGRSHTYEHDDCAAMAGAIRSLHTWGVHVLVLTNAAGSLRPTLPPGSLMLLADHINAPQRSPLVGETSNRRFVDMGAAYDPALRAHALQVAAQQQLPLVEGTYLWALGPQFETPAEVRMFAAWGADAVGMSTVPETIVARHCGLRVLGLSLITNVAAGLSAEVLSHAATLQQAQAAGATAAGLLTALIASLPDTSPQAATETAANSLSIQ